VAGVARGRWTAIEASSVDQTPLPAKDTASGAKFTEFGEIIADRGYLDAQERLNYPDGRQ
jgi:hypothetical protein